MKSNILTLVWTSLSVAVQNLRFLSAEPSCLYPPTSWLARLSEDNTVIVPYHFSDCPFMLSSIPCKSNAHVRLYYKHCNVYILPVPKQLLCPLQCILKLFTFLYFFGHQSILHVIWYGSDQCCFLICHNSEACVNTEICLRSGRYV